MRPLILARSVRGAAHIRSGLKCQDSLKRVRLKGGSVILAAADGHGSDSCPFSRAGSKIAVRVFTDIMSGLCERSDNADSLASYLKREGDTLLSRRIAAEWRRRVLKRHEKVTRRPLRQAEDAEGVLRLYGTTLLGLLIMETFVFAFQLGDGDICFVNGDGVEPVLKADKMLGVETHSLCHADAWRKAVTALWRTPPEDRRPCMFTLTTDGFANSYKSDEDFRSALKDYFMTLRQYGARAVSQSLPQWLKETSAMGSGDDITMIMAVEGIYAERYRREKI